MLPVAGDNLRIVDDLAAPWLRFSLSASKPSSYSAGLADTRAFHNCSILMSITRRCVAGGKVGWGRSPGRGRTEGNGCSGAAKSGTAFTFEYEQGFCSILVELNGFLRSPVILDCQWGRFRSMAGDVGVVASLVRSRLRLSAVVSAGILCSAAAVSGQPRALLDSGPPTAEECSLEQLRCYVDRDGQPTNEAAAYRRLVARGRPYHLRTAIELSLFLAGGAAWYWIDRERQVADWDFPSVKERLTFEAWRFDNNPFGINFAWHVLSGTGFHAVARANNFGLLGAIGYGFAASMAWEYLLEFREKVSVNDSITTTGAGISLGEFFNWLGRYTHSQTRRRRLVSAMRLAANWPRSLHYGLFGGHRPNNGDRTYGTTRQLADSLGFHTDIWHRFNIAYGIGFIDSSGGQRQTDADGPVHQLRLAGRLVALPGYLRQGRLRRPFAEGNLTSLEVAFDKRPGDWAVRLNSDAMLVGLYYQSIDASHNGYGFAVGSPIAYQYRRENLGEWNDRLAVLHLPGAGADLDLLSGRWRLHIATRAHLDFAGVHALANSDWERENSDVVAKAIVRREGYYFGWGGSSFVRAELLHPRLRLGVSAFYGRYNSDEGLDRMQEEVEHDVKLRDTVTEYRGWARFEPVRGPYAEFRFARQRRVSHQGPFRRQQQLQRAQLAVGVEF